MSGVLFVSNDLVGDRMAGPAIRALELSRALHAAGIDLSLATPGAGVPGSPFRTLPYGADGRSLRDAAATADAVVVQGLVLSHHPFLAALDVPIVVDIYDPFVLENLQSRSGQVTSGRNHHHRTDLAALAGQLERGDFFVCASESQRDFWVGMLTALGRVNPATYDADPALRRLIDVVPFGIPDSPPTARAPALRGVVPNIDDDSFILLWGGGIWNWFDPLTLIRAVAEVAIERPHVRLVFMGTRAPSRFAPDDTMAAAARGLARDLGVMDRVVRFNDGWVPYDGRAAYLLESDLGVSCHLPHIETRYAYRTRLLDCIWAGLPMLVTEGDVLADVVAREELGRTVPPEDVPATVVALRDLIDAREGKAAYAERFARLRPSLSWSAAAAPLVRFLADPRRAPDRPRADARVVDVPTTPVAQLPRRGWELLREGGPLLLTEEAIRYIRWRRRGH